jgi:hypothetical protein
LNNKKLILLLWKKSITHKNTFMKILRYMMVALIATSLFSCKKDNNKNDNKDCALSEANLGGTYKLGSVKYKASASSPEIDATSMVDACSLDDLETFKSDHSLVYVDAGVKCDPPGDGTDTWALSGNSLTAGGNVGTITSFNCTGFTISHADFMQSGDSLIVTFKKQ